nr:MAG TPA: hypothetical protein [Caudoviricetes sp.]
MNFGDVGGNQPHKSGLLHVYPFSLATSQSSLWLLGFSAS